MCGSSKELWLILRFIHYSDITYTDRRSDHHWTRLRWSVNPS